MQPVNYRIGHFVVLQLTKDAKDTLKQAFEEDGVFNFSEFDEDDVKIVAEFEGVGVGELV